jgi:hypothetical protein
MNNAEARDKIIQFINENKKYISFVKATSNPPILLKK